jgi:hypothetical protein
MLERPFPRYAAFVSPGNLMEVLRRTRHATVTSPRQRRRETLTRAQYEDYFKFTIVRNPWARAWSWYRNVMRGGRNARRLNVQPGLEFTEFLQRHLGRDALRPQLCWLRDFNGELPLDFIGRFECLREDFDTVAERLGMPGLQLPHRRRSEGAGRGEAQDYRGHYDTALIERVALAYREEIELFGYDFENG